MKLWQTAYTKARNDLKKEIVASLKADARNEGTPDSPVLNRMVDSRAERLLEDFQRLAEDRAFRSGVIQSFLGSIFFALIPGVIYLIYLGGTHYDLWSKLFRHGSNN